MAQEEDRAANEDTRTNHINYGTSKKPGLLGAVEDFKNHHSREFAVTLAKRLTERLMSGERSEELRAACKEFLSYCRATLFYERDLDAREINEGKINPTEALNALRAALKEAFPIEAAQISVSRVVTAIAAK